jgi:AcrR family transcriptional regulator
MSWDRDRGSGERRSYHHGNLREALIKAALDLIAQKGPAGFTFAEAARAAGVSPAAPYRHYRDRDALMADVAARGFAAFEARLSGAWNGGKPGLAFSAFPELHTAGERAFNVLRDACAALIETMPAGKRPPVMMMALHIWALSHGIASLFARGDGARRPIPMPPEDLLDAAVLLYLDGLGVRKG